MKTFHLGDNLKRLLKFVKKAVPAAVVLAVGLVFCGGVVRADAQLSVDKAIRSAVKRYRKVKRITADAQMRRYDGRLRETDETLGTVLFARGSGRDFSLRVDWKRPKESLSVHNGTFTLYRERLSTALVGSVRDGIVNRDDGNSLDFLLMSGPEILARYDRSLGGTEKLPDGAITTRIRATPKAKSDYTAADLWIDKRGLIRQIMIFDLTDGHTTITLTNIKKNPRIHPARFEIKLPKKTRVERFLKHIP